MVVVGRPLLAWWSVGFGARRWRTSHITGFYFLPGGKTLRQGRGWGRAPRFTSNVNWSIVPHIFFSLSNHGKANACYFSRIELKSDNSFIWSIFMGCCEFSSMWLTLRGVWERRRCGNAVGVGTPSEDHRETAQGLRRRFSQFVLERLFNVTMSP